MKIEINTDRIEAKDALAVTSIINNDHNYIIYDESKNIYRIKTMSLERGISGYMTVGLFIEKIVENKTNAELNNEPMMEKVIRNYELPKDTNHAIKRTSRRGKQRI